MKKQLTKEAKIHLATKVDDYIESGDTLNIRWLKKKESLYILLDNYNPHDSESLLKYLRDLFNSLKNQQKDIIMYNLYKMKGAAYTIGLFLNGLDKFIEAILKVTGYTGEVWE